MNDPEYGPHEGDWWTEDYVTFNRQGHELQMRGHKLRAVGDVNWVEMMQDQISRTPSTRSGVSTDVWFLHPDGRWERVTHVLDLRPRIDIFKDLFVQRALRWAWWKGSMLQRELETYYGQIGGTKNCQFRQCFMRYVVEQNGSARNVVLREAPNQGPRNKQIVWCGPTWKNWCRLSSDEQIERWYQLMEAQRIARPEDECDRLWFSDLSAELKVRVARGAGASNKGVAR